MKVTSAAEQVIQTPLLHAATVIHWYWHTVLTLV